MKRYTLSVMAIAAAAVLLTAAEREGRGGGGGDSRGGGGGGEVRAESGGGRTYSAPAARHAGTSTIYRQQRVTVPRATMPAPEHVLRDQGRPVYPRRNESGAPITKRASAVPPSQHAEVVRNTNVVRNIQIQQRNEVVPNRYYWHEDHGMRYSHYYDGHNHWYGFYHGPTFYWTRYHNDRWWWYDSQRLRWVFWWDGFWWWPGPGGASYVYVDNNYYPYEDSGVTVEHVQEQPVPAEMPVPDAGTAVNSPDGKRLVQLFGTDGQAFLYDKTASPPKFMKYLGQGVSRVRFSSAAGGASQILVEYKDDTFALFDQDGNSQSSAVKTEESTSPAPPETPDSIPPPPSSAPGQ